MIPTMSIRWGIPFVLLAAGVVCADQAMKTSWWYWLAVGACVVALVPAVVWAQRGKPPGHENDLDV
jgi:hypothetical protein